MNSTFNNIFQQLLIEEFEKNKDKNNMDVVAVKREQFNTLLDKAHNELRNESYDTATLKYYTVINFLKGDPYPDELELTTEMDFSIKCCFCYSGLMSPDLFKDDDVSNALVDIIKELNDKFRRRLFPMFVLVLLNFHRKNWLTTLTWCNEVANHVDEEESCQGTDFFKELLPNASQIRIRVEKCEEIAYFGYGELLARNSLVKPRFEKYKDWSYKLNDFIASRLVKLRSPVSDSDLHSVFHNDIFPIWCLATGKEYKEYFSDKYMTKCNKCMRAKLHTSIPKDEIDSMEDLLRFENYVDHCVELYNKYPFDHIFDTKSTWSRNSKPFSLTETEVKRGKDTTRKKKVCSVLCQTDKLKTNNKSTQTECTKIKNVEVQVSNDSQMLNAILEIKNKCLTLQEKKDDTISKLTKKITDLQEKSNKDHNARKIVDNEFEKKTANSNFEIQKLKEQLAEYEKKLKSESDKNISLQKLLVEQINDKYNGHKQQYKVFEKQAQFMVAYLRDLISFLSPKSIPDKTNCKYNIDMWEHQLQKIRNSLEQLNSFYHGIRTDMIKSDTYNIQWPEMPEFLRYEDNIIFQSFKLVIKNIIQMEEKLFWKFNTDYQSQLQRTPNVAQVNNFQYNVQRPQFPAQNNVYTGSRLVYSNTPGSMPVSLQYPPQQVQQPQPGQNMEKLPGAVNVDPKQFADQNKRTMSRSMEHLNKGAGPGPQAKLGHGKKKEVAEVKGACAVKKKKGKKEKDMILLDYVMEHCSGTTEQEVTLALLHLLEENKGTLSNIPKEKVVEDVKIILRMKKQAAWVTPKSPHVEWNKDDMENECSICCEAFSLQEKYILPCKHEYHKECIKKWLKLSSVCPICRIHTVIDEEFPPLH